MKIHIIIFIILLLLSLIIKKNIEGYKNNDKKIKNNIIIDVKKIKNKNITNNKNIIGYGRYILQNIYK